MGFRTHTTDDGYIPANFYLPASDITPEIGMALGLNAGLLEPVTGADTPAYLCAREQNVPCEEGDILPVIRVLPDMELIVPCAEDFSSVVVGQKVGIDGTGTQVTASAGAFEVTGIDGTEPGSLITGRFSEGN